jgi:vitamin B12 transporter
MFFFAHVLGTVLAFSPSPSPSPSSSPLPEIAHVYTTDRTDETLTNAARTTYVVTREQIVRNGYRTVGESIANLPGVQVLPYGAFGSTVNYSVRGSNSAQILVLIDGLPAPGSFANSVELGNLPTTGVQRIEVVEGGGSTLFGSGAIGGIINVITQRASGNSATLRYGSFGDRELEIATDHVQISRAVTNNNFGLPGGLVQPDSDYQTSAIHVDGGHRIGAFDATVRASLSADHSGTPGVYPFQSVTARENDLNGNANLTLDRKTARAETTVQFGGTTQQITYACNPNASVDPNCFQSTPSLSTERRVDFSARNVVGGSNEQLLYGIDLSRGFVRGDAGGNFSINALAQAAAYVQQHVDTRWGTLYYGMRGERDGSLGGEFSPSAGLVARLSKEVSIKGNIATAFRAPNASELYFPGYGYAQLHPERAKVGDLSITDSHLFGGVTLGWFTNRTNDLIVPVLLDPSTFTFGPRNIDHAFIQGFTLDVRTPSFHRITTSLNLTDLYRAQDLDAQTRLPNDAVMTANLRLDYAGSTAGALDSLGFIVHAAGARGFVDPTKPLFDQPAAFTTLDAYLRLRAGRTALVTLRGFNLGNERYASVGGFGNAVNGYPMPGRSFIVELSSK